MENLGSILSGDNVTEKVRNERAFVASCVANPELIEMYMLDHYLCEVSWWESDLYYHIFMMMMCMKCNGEAPGLFQRLKDEGIKIAVPVHK